jgi:phosphoribosyl-AMP cyclohydrolase
MIFSPGFLSGGKKSEREKMIDLDFDKMGGLIPAIIQDNDTGEVLMLGFMNKEAWDVTLKSGKATFFSRTRNKLWIKGETSGHVQIVREIRIDCDNDTVLLKIDQVGGAACHTGYKSCFFRKMENGELKTIGAPIFNPEEVYPK